MKYRLIAAAMAVLVSATVPVSRVFADDVPDEVLSQVQDKCIYIQSSLRRLHTSDALLRVNVGQLYEAVAAKLMGPLNTRVDLNRYDSLSLVRSAKDYGIQLDAFRRSYGEYESSMSRTIAIDCKKKAREFYASLETTRLNREKVHQDAVVLLSIAEQYGAQVMEMAQGVGRQ